MPTPQSSTQRADFSARLMVMCSQMFYGVIAISIVPAMPEIAKWHGPDGALYAQMLLVAPALSIIIGSPLAGPLGRLVGPRRLTLISICLYVLSGMYGLVAPDSASLMLSRLIVGFASAQISALALGLLGDFEPVTRARLIGLAGMLSGVAAVAGVAAGGWLTQGLGWRAGFALFAWPLPLLPFALWGMPASAIASTAAARGWRDALTPLKPAVPVYLLMFLAALMMFAPSIQGPFVLAGRGLRNAADLGDILSGTCAVSAVAGACYGWLAARRGEHFQLQFLFASFLVTALLISAGHALTLATIGLVFAGLPCGLTVPILVTRLSLRLPPEQMTTGMGVLMSCISISQLSEPSILQGIQRFTPLTPFAMIALVCVLALAVTLFGTASRLIPRPRTIS